MIKKWLATLATGMIAATSVATPTGAHHTHAMFDSTILVGLTGKIAAVRYVNPHVYLQIDVDQKDGAAIASPERWTIEFTGTGPLTGLGMPSSAFQEGMPIEMRVNPLRNGTPGGSYKHMVMLNGILNTAADTDNKWIPPGAAGAAPVPPAGPPPAGGPPAGAPPA